METLIDTDLTSYHRALLNAVDPPLKNIVTTALEKAPAASSPLTAKAKTTTVLPFLKTVLIVGGVCVVAYSAFKLYEKYRDEQEFSTKAKLAAPKS